MRKGDRGHCGLRGWGSCKITALPQDCPKSANHLSTPKILDNQADKHLDKHLGHDALAAWLSLSCLENKMEMTTGLASSRRQWKPWYSIVKRTSLKGTTVMMDTSSMETGGTFVPQSSEVVQQLVLGGAVLLGVPPFIALRREKKKPPKH